MTGRIDDMTIVIPTYRREAVMVRTVDAVLALRPSAIILVDQSPDHDAGTVRTLRRWRKGGVVQYVRLSRPNIPAAMNSGLCRAGTPYVLFLDDDLVPDTRLLAAHVEAMREHPERWCVAGQVIQTEDPPSPRLRRASRGRQTTDAMTTEYTEGGALPLGGIPPSIINDQPSTAAPRFLRDQRVDFSMGAAGAVGDVMAGNLCVRRERALAVGGFDENFVGAGYRFESDFARRVLAAGGQIWFEPGASVEHLNWPTGGTRAFGDKQRTWRPFFSVGKYYFALRVGGVELARSLLIRPWRDACTRYTARHPWYLPASLLSELLGLGHALGLRARGPRLLALGDAD